MKKKIVVLLLTVALFVCVFSVSAFADDCTLSHVSITGTRGRPNGASGGDIYTAVYSQSPYWVSWTRPSNNIAVRLVQGYLYKDGSFEEYNENIKPISLYVDNCVDGYFGGTTEECIRIYQRNHGLTVDGEVGTNTWTDMAFYNYRTSIAHLLPYDDPLR